MCTERMENETFATYKFDDRCKVIPGNLTPVVDFNNLKELLLSQDHSQKWEINWAHDKQCRFLNGN